MILSTIKDEKHTIRKYNGLLEVFRLLVSDQVRELCPETSKRNTPSEDHYICEWSVLNALSFISVKRRTKYYFTLTFQTLKDVQYIV